MKIALVRNFCEYELSNPNGIFTPAAFQLFLHFLHPPKAINYF